MYLYTVYVRVCLFVWGGGGGLLSTAHVLFFIWQDIQQVTLVPWVRVKKAFSTTLETETSLFSPSLWYWRTKEDWNSVQHGNMVNSHTDCTAQSHSWYPVNIPNIHKKLASSKCARPSLSEDKARNTRLAQQMQCVQPRALGDISSGNPCCYSRVYIDNYGHYYISLLLLHTVSFLMACYYAPTFSSNAICVWFLTQWKTCLKFLNHRTLMMQYVKVSEQVHQNSRSEVTVL